MSFRSYPRPAKIPEGIPYYDQLQTMLDAGNDFGEGYEADTFALSHNSAQVRRLRFCPSDAVMVELRQVSYTPEVASPTTDHSEVQSRGEYNGAIAIDLCVMIPAINFRLQHEDGLWCSTPKASWRVTAQNRVEADMRETHGPEHGDFTTRTRLEHLELALGQYPVAMVVPHEFEYLKV